VSYNIFNKGKTKPMTNPIKDFATAIEAAIINAVVSGGAARFDLASVLERQAAIQREWDAVCTRAPSAPAVVHAAPVPSATRRLVDAIRGAQL
jgi:hypothetical protein